MTTNSNTQNEGARQKITSEPALLPQDELFVVLSLPPGLPIHCCINIVVFALLTVFPISRKFPKL